MEKGQNMTIVKSLGKLPIKLLIRIIQIPLKVIVTSHCSLGARKRLLLRSLPRFSERKP